MHLATALLSITLLQAPAESPAELGRVNWGRDLDAALKSSRRDERPLLLLFQEVPG